MSAQSYTASYDALSIILFLIAVGRDPPGGFSINPGQGLAQLYVNALVPGRYTLLK